MLPAPQFVIAKGYLDFSLLAYTETYGLVLEIERSIFGATTNFPREFYRQ